MKGFRTLAWLEHRGFEPGLPEEKSYTTAAKHRGLFA
jgi:hypothetical protein